MIYKPRKSKNTRKNKIGEKRLKKSEECGVREESIHIRLKSEYAFINRI
jgi:hypothetical protein